MTEKIITVGIVGNQYASGGSQPLIDIDSPFNLNAGRPYDSNVHSDSPFYIEVKQTDSYTSYIYNLRPNRIHSAGASLRDGVFWIAMTIPSIMNVYDQMGNCISPLDVLESIFAIFATNYMTQRANGSYEFKEVDCFSRPVRDYLSELTLKPNPFITPVSMDSNGDMCYLAMDREKMGLFLKDTQYKELAQYRTVIVAESILSQSMFNSPIPRPLNISVKYRSTELGKIDYYSKQDFRCTAYPDDPVTHSSVEIHFGVGEFNDKKLKKSNFSAEIIKSPSGESYISFNPEFPANSTFFPIQLEDSLRDDMYIENGKGDVIRASRPEGQSAYGFLLIGSQLRDEWKLHHKKGKLSDIVWRLEINGNGGLPTNPTWVATNNISIAEKDKRSSLETVKDVKAPTNTKSLNEPGRVDILSLDDIRHNVLKKDGDAKLILSYGEGGNKIIVEKVIAYEINWSWELGAPFNPYLEGYQLEIKSKKFEFTTKKSTDGSALFTIDKITPIEPFYEHVLDTVKKHSRIVWASVAVLAVLIIEFLCYKYNVAWHNILPPPAVEISDELTRSKPNNAPKNDPSYNPGTAEITLEDIRGYVSELKYNNIDLSFADLKKLLAQLPDNQQDYEEVNCLINICNEIETIQKGHLCAVLNWRDYLDFGGKKLRDNVDNLVKISQPTYQKLKSALAPYYQHTPTLERFQRKYIEFSDTKPAPREDDLKTLQGITTFAGLRKLYEDFTWK